MTKDCLDKMSKDVNIGLRIIRHCPIIVVRCLKCWNRRNVVCYTVNQSQPSSILFSSHLSICSSFSNRNFFCTFISCVLFFTQNVLSHISELDFDFIKWLRAQVQGMRKKQIWQPALRKLFSFPAPDDRQEALKFLLQTMKKFQVVFLLRFCPDLHSLFPVFTH